MWFTENAWPPMLIAGLVALIFIGMWNGNRRGIYLVIAGVCLAMIGVFYVMERAIITQGELLQQDVVQVCEQFRKRDPAIVNHFSEKAGSFRLLVIAAMAVVEVRSEIRTTDFQTTFTNENSRANVHFRANGEFAAMGFSGAHPFRCILTYQKEGSDWKIVEVQRLDPINGKKMEIMEPR